MTFATSTANEIAKAAYKILKEQWLTGKPIRMLTVAAISLIDDGDDVSQSDFFCDEDDEKRMRAASLESTLDKIKNKYGHSSISRASVIKNDIGLSASEIRKTDSK